MIRFAERARPAPKPIASRLGGQPASPGPLQPGTMRFTTRTRRDGKGWQQFDVLARDSDGATTIAPMRGVLRDHLAQARRSGFEVEVFDRFADDRVAA